MIRKINIGDQPVELNTSMGWLYKYREQFGHDILPDLLPLLDTALGALGDIYENAEAAEGGNILGALTDDAVEKMMMALTGLETLTITNTIWAMAKNAAPDIEDPETWVNGFDCFPMDEIVPEAVKLIAESSVSRKNFNRLMGRIKEARGQMSRSTSQPSPSQGQEEG